MNSIKIDSIKKHSYLIESILDLHRKNTKTLGFLPKSAFIESEKHNRIIIALDNNDNLCGYVLYSINKRGNFVYIVHFCIDENYRGRGLSRRMNEYLVKLTKANYRGIRVTCRQDFTATNVWAKLGFSVKYEKFGKKKDGSTLLVWWLDFNHDDLFTLYESDKIGAVLDSNIVFELSKEVNIENEIEYALLADWLSNEIKYYITNEFDNDVNRSRSLKKRAQGRIISSNYEKVSGDNNKFLLFVEEIKKHYPKTLRMQDESDIRHLAWTIVSKTIFFITNDRNLQNKSDLFFGAFGIRIFSPTEFLLEYDFLKNYTDYLPVRFSGTTLEIKKPKVDEVREIVGSFLHSSEERKKDFKKGVEDLLNKEGELFVIKDNKIDYVFYSCCKIEDNVLEVHFFRISNSIDSITIANQVVNNMILKANQVNSTIIKISERFLEKSIISLIERFGFIKNDKCYYKFVKSDIIDFKNITKYIKNNTERKEIADIYIDYLPIYLRNYKKYSANLLVGVERLFWPLKFFETKIPCYVIPIKPEWAMNLFHAKLSEWDLFGAKQRLLFSYENAYYRSARQKLPKSPSRVLWYITKGNMNSDNTMEVCAASFVTNVMVDKPKKLFKKNQRLGVYEWKDVFKKANSNTDTDVLAFTFDQTELFEKPLSIDRLNYYFNKHHGKKFFPPQAPIKIGESLFFDIYKSGINK